MKAEDYKRLEAMVAARKMDKGQKIALIVSFLCAVGAVCLMVKESNDNHSDWVGFDSSTVSPKSDFIEMPFCDPIAKAYGFCQ